MNYYTLEWDKYDGPIARVISAKGNPTSAYVRLRLDKPRPKHIPEKLWKEAQALQAADDEKAF